MQEAPLRRTTERFLSPARAALLAVLALGSCLTSWGLVGRASPGVLTLQPEASAASRPRTDVTQRLRVLERTLWAAYHAHDVTLLDLVYTSTSPVRRIAFDEIQQLIDDKVVDRSKQTISSLQVESLTDRAARIRGKALIEPKYLHRGIDVTTPPRRQEQAVLWTLRQENGEWRIHDSIVVAAQAGRS